MKKTQYFDNRLQQDLRTGRLFIDFVLGEDLYAIDMTKVSRVITNFELFEVPCVPPFIAGMIAVEDSFTTVIDLRSFLEIRGAEVEAKSLVEIRVENQSLAFLADSVPGFMTLYDDIEAEPGAGLSILVGRCQHRGQQVNILDAEQMLWILTGNFERIQPQIIDSVEESQVVEDTWQGDEDQCPRCGGHGFIVVNNAQLFATVVGAFEEFKLGRRMAESLPAPSDIVDLINLSLISTSPADAIHENLSPVLPTEFFEELLQRIELSHLQPCPACR